MPPSQFPTPFSSSYPTEPAGPRYLKLERLVSEWRSLVEKEFKDGGVSMGLSNTTPVLQWEFNYDGLTSTEAAMLDEHYEDALGRFYGFTFRDPWTGELFNDVHYELFEKDHEKVWSNKRHLILIKRPGSTEAVLTSELVFSGDGITFGGDLVLF